MSWKDKHTADRRRLSLHPHSIP